MKKQLFSFLLLMGGVISSLAIPINLSVQIDDHTPTCPSVPKSPILVPIVDLTAGIVTFQEGHADYTLEILDEDGLVVYSANVPTAVTNVVLPTWLSGDYEIRLLTGGTYYFYGDITL